MSFLRRGALALVLVAAVAGRAQAHASLISSSPSNGQVVASSPASIRLVFSEPIVADLSHIMLLSADGHHTKLEVTGDPHEVRALIASTPSLANGGYRIDWHIVSADGHPVSGYFTFSVGAAAPAPAMMMSGTDHGEMHMEMEDRSATVAGAAILPALFRGAALSALLGLCGMLGFAGYSQSRTRSQEKLCTWLAAGSVVFLVIHLVLWLAHVSPEGILDEAVVRSALSREAGFNEMLRLILAALAAWALLLARSWKIAFAFALAAVLAGGTIGHPAAIDPVLAIPAKAVHLVGVAFWFGGILWLATSDTDSPEVVASAMTVSSAALVSISLVAITGIVQSILFLNGFADLIATPYGLTILGKTAGLAVLFLFGAYHRFKLLPRLGSDGAGSRLKQSLRGEILTMIAVILIGGFLAYVPVPLHNP